MTSNETSGEWRRTSATASSTPRIGTVAAAKVTSAGRQLVFTQFVELFTLRRAENRVYFAAGFADDGIDAWLRDGPRRAQFALLAIHQRIELSALIRAEIEILRQPLLKCLTTPRAEQRASRFGGRADAKTPRQ